MAFDTTGFDQLRETLKKQNGRASQLYALGNQPINPSKRSMIKVSQTIPDLGTIFLEIDNKFIQGLLNELYL